MFHLARDSPGNSKMEMFTRHERRNETNYTFIILHAKVKGFHTSFSRRNLKMSVKYFIFFKIIFHEQKTRITD